MPKCKNLQKILNGEIWSVILPENKKSCIVHIMEIIDHTPKTITLSKVNGEKRWIIHDTYKRSKVQFLEKVEK